MTGLRTYTTNLPNIWRFPQWKDEVYYPSGSFVAVSAYNPVDSEIPLWSFYVASVDVSPIVDSERQASYAPNDSDSDWALSKYGTNPWSLAFDTTADTFNAQLIADVAALQPLLALLGIDSDINLLYEDDSDQLIRITNLDSDVLMEIHDRMAADSEIDSEIKRVEHNYQAADSDILIIIADNDSEIRRMLDSEIHDRKAADSDLQIQITDNDSDILMEIHDRKAADSDIRVDVDSDILRVHINADSDSDRLTNFIHDYEERDSDINVKFAEIDSDIANIKISNDQVTGGFPVGAIQAFASTTMPTGFRIADGSTFDQLAYPDLFTILGTNTLPDLRGYFLRGHSDDASVDEEGPRAPLSIQQDAHHEHNHQWHEENAGGDGRLDASGDSFESATYQADGVSYRSIGGNEFYNDAWTSTVRDLSSGAQETRPKNVAVVYGIAMYNGAGVQYDSDIFESILTIRLRDYDSDLNALYNRTDFHSQTYSPDSDVAVGETVDVGVTISDFTDIDVMLNGVSVTQYTTAGSVFTLNFGLRANIDVVTFKLRR